MDYVLAALVGYLFGSVPTGLLIARLRGIDIRTVGSGNIGATNVARTLGRTWGLLVLAIDAMKGLAPTYGAVHFGWSGELAGLAAVLGHVFPVWLRFRGGKGVATGLGVFLALAPVASAVAVVCYVGVVLATRLSSLGSLVGAVALLLAMWATGSAAPVLLLGGATCMLIVVKHAANIRRLIRGEESKV